ncbi:MAG: choice-of-anchor tandem repeat GloVer-containing protein, partial [Candidatus Cybelea sp.]
MQDRCFVVGMLVWSLGLTACSWQGATPAQSGARNSVIDPTASGEGYKLIYAFPGGAGGADPIAPPTFVGGVAFGATYSGGDVSGCNCGTVFANGKVIYNFKGASSGDGAYPTGAFLLVGKELYGVTLQGGRPNGVCTSGNIRGCGTILAIDAKGNERVIYRFKGGSDGEAPVGALVSKNGVLYGVTAKGGTNGTCSDGLPGCGVVFSVDSSGHEKVIYRFKGGTDGALPSTGLLVVKGQLYGTTATGGGDCPSSTSGCGTVFRMTPSGSEKIIHAFKGGEDGQYPNSALILANDSLYGTTGFGGCPRACGPSGG